MMFFVIGVGGKIFSLAFKEKPLEKYGTIWNNSLVYS